MTARNGGRDYHVRFCFIVTIALRSITHSLTIMGNKDQGRNRADYYYITMGVLQDMHAYNTGGNRYSDASYLEVTERLGVRVRLSLLKYLHVFPHLFFLFRD